MKGKVSARDAVAREKDSLPDQETPVTRRIAAVRAAIFRVDVGSYGICLVCGKPITDTRLAAKPEATRCVACAKRA